MPYRPRAAVLLHRAMSKIFIARGAAAVLALGLLLVWQPVVAPFAEIVAPEPEPDPSVLFMGDSMLDRNVAVHAREAGAAALFAGIADYIQDADARVANLEGAITTNPSVAQVDHTILHFTFDPVLAQAALKPLTLTAVSLANNHAYDFGRTGYDTTQMYLKEWGITPFGHPYNARDLSATLTIRGKHMCLVGYHSLFDAGTAEVVDEILRLRPMCYRLVVFPHWGEEYTPVANAQQVGAAHEFIDAGADLVVGAHPHVVQNVEVYRGRVIFYSLGNFMFDQNFSWATTHGLMVKVTFGEAQTRFNLVPVTVKDEEVSLANEADSRRVLETAGRLAEFTLP